MKAKEKEEEVTIRKVDIKWLHTSNNIQIKKKGFLSRPSVSHQFGKIEQNEKKPN